MFNHNLILSKKSMTKVAKKTLNEVVESPVMEERSLPSFSVDEKDLPAIKNWKIGEKYTIEIEVEMTEIGKREYGEEKGEMYARFSVKEFVNCGKETEEEEKVEAKVEGAYKAK